MLWLNQECECQKLDLELGAPDRVGPPLLPPLSLSSCEAVWLLLSLSHLMSLPLASGSRHTGTGSPPPRCPL